MFIELGIAHRAPVVSSGVHREAWRQSPVSADDQRVPAGAASPGFDVSAQELFHLPQAGFLIDDLVALLMLLQDPVDQFVHPRIILWCEERAVLVQVFEMW